MRDKHISLILMLGVVVTVALGVVVLIGLGVLRPVLSLAQPHVYEVVEPEQRSVSITPSPAPTAVPTATPIPTPPAYPKNAVNLLVGGTPLMALANPDAARQMLEDYLTVCAYENLAANERLIRAYIDAELSLAPVDGSVEYIPYEQAKANLLQNRTLVPVTRTTERVAFEIGTFDTTIGEQPALPRGTRMLLSAGNAERRMSLHETIHKNGLMISESQTLAPVRVGSEASARSIQNGTADMPDNSQPDAVFPKGKDAGELKFSAPCRGTVISGFGLRDGVMHYGVDYGLKPGGAIVAPESGTVVFCGTRGEYGLVIEIRHGNGFVSRLTHCASPSVELGRHVYKGDQIALLALEETEPNPHLHYELLIDGIPFDPMQYLQ